MTWKIWWNPMKKYRYTAKTIKPMIMMKIDFLIENNLVNDNENHSSNKTEIHSSVTNKFKVIFFFKQDTD